MPEVPLSLHAFAKIPSLIPLSRRGCYATMGEGARLAPALSSAERAGRIEVARGDAA